MSSANRALLIVMLVTTLGLWGCTQNRNGSTTAAKLRDLEARNAKLEEDYRTSVAEGVQIRKKLAQVEQQSTQLSRQLEQLQSVVQERDRLRQQVASSTGERDALHDQLVNFSRELQTLAGRVEAAANQSATPQPVTSASSPSTARKS